MEQAYTHEFQCVYQLDKYPFDTQVRLSAYHMCSFYQECLIEMHLKGVLLAKLLNWFRGF